MRRIALATLLATCTLTGLWSQAVIPAPARLLRGQGGFTLGPGTVIQAQGDARPLGETLAGYLRPATGLPLPVQDAAAGRDVLRLVLEPRTGPDGAGAAEGYRLDVDADAVELRAPEPAGLFHGLQTLRQLLPGQIFRAAQVPGVAWTLPAVAIEDRPRFPWRGSHLDVGRHFLPMAFIKKHLDLMALHKLNVFHWHLTEDQGWRLELLRHPLLAQVGGWRRETVLPEFSRVDFPDQMRFDHTPCGGFYTQDDVREIVRYAADRFITVVPEIELPGHCTAAIAACPELGNDPGRPVEVATRWGEFETVFNVEDSTLALLKDVLDETLELFPSRYIHIGGDECPKTEWAHSERALARMISCGLVPPGTTLADIQQYRDAGGKPAEHPALARLQSWFIAQMDAHLTARGRHLVGWDEILEGGLAEGATVMCWRGESGAVAAARAGHDVVMAPMDTTYFSQYETRGPEPLGAGGFIPLDQVYAFDPVPAGLAPGEAGHILGAEGALWTEFVATPERAEYQLWPRLAALAEVLWSPAGDRDFPAFRSRLDQHLKRLDALDVAYHPQ
jgi:hexosaminidase